MHYDKNIQIYKDILAIYAVNKKALRAVEKTAQKYRYNDIFREAAVYEIKNEEILRQIFEITNYYQDTIGPY